MESKGASLKSNMKENSDAILEKDTLQKPKMEADFDAILENIGSKGRYQFKMIYFVLVPICFLLGYNICQFLFQVAVPRYWCHVPGRENTSMSPLQWMNLTLPKDNNTGEFSKCLRYISNWTQDQNLPLVDTGQTENCIDGWDFDHSQFQETVATSFEWYCDKESYSPNLLTVNSAGNAFGTFMFPLLSDIFGRRPIFFSILITHLVFTLGYIWLPFYGVQMAMRFFRGTIELSIYLIPHVTVLELMSPDDRAKATLIGWVAWISGMCATAGIAWLIPHWQYLAYSSLIPFILGFVYWNHFPESPRWLLSKGRVSECADMLLKISKMNGNKDISQPDLEKKLEVIVSNQQREVSLLQAFKYPKLRLRIIMLLIMSPCVYFVYGITLFGINVLPDNQFLSHFILSLFEMPSNFIGMAMVNYLGRRVSCYLTFGTTGLFCFIGAFCTHEKWLRMLMVSLIKLWDTTALFAMYVVTSEILPTPIRSSGLGSMVVTGLLSMALAPLILHSSLGPTFQYWVMLGVMILSVLIALAMPETIGLPLPQTFQEAEDIGSDRPLTTWVHRWNQHKFPGKRANAVELEASDEDDKKKIEF